MKVSAILRSKILKAGASGAVVLSMPFWAVSLPFCDSAEAKFGRKGKHTQSAADDHFDEGIAKMKKVDLDGAIDAFSQAIYFARNGYHPQSHYWLGMCYMGKFEDKKAILSLEKAIQQSIVPLPDAFVAMAEINIRNHDFDSARRNISSAMMNKASFQRCSYLRALMSDAEGKYAVAAGQYRSALGKAPWTWTECWVKYAETLMKMKKWQEAIREFYSILHTDTPLKNEPLDRIYHDIGVCLLAIGDHQGAIDNWFRSLDYNKTNPEVWLQLGMLYEAEKHFSSAVNNYKEFLRLLPPESQDPRIQQVQDRLTKIEHQLRPNETVPEIAKPSPYMRRQVEGAISPQQLNNPDAAAEQAPPVSDMDSGF